MAVSLEAVIGSYTPLTVSGNQFVGPCIFEAHEGELEVIGDRWRCACGAHSDGDDAVGFLMLAEKIDRAQAEHQLTNGRAWTPTLIKPAPPPARYGMERLASDPRPALIVDSRAAAKAADEKLTRYAVVLWPGGGRRWDALEPLREREVLLWPTVEGLEAMERLEAVLADPRGLACTGKLIVPSDAAPWDAETDEIVSWAKARARPLNPAQQVEPAIPPPSGAQGEAKPPTGGQSATATSPPAAAGPIPADLSPPEPPPLSDTDFPAGAAKSKPKRRQRHLSVVEGNTALVAEEPDAEPLPHGLSESGIAEHFVALHKDRFRTVHEWSGKQGACWMAWDGTRWLREPNRVTAMQEARKLAHAVKHWDEARGVSELSKVKWESRKFIGAFLDIASYIEDFIASPQQFDADPFQLGTPAGTVDLRTGKLCAAAREHYITRQTTVSPEAGPHPLFDDVIRRASGGEQDIAEYLWRWLGYVITGSVKEKAFLYLYGKTDSGKTTLATAIASILGDSDQGGYAAQCDVDMFTESKLEKGTDRLAHLAGARFAYASEMEEGRNFKTALLKLATGGDNLHGRFLYAEQFSFAATHKLWIFGNHQMHMKSSDNALLNRLHLLEYKDAFIITPEERDTSFQERLQAEYPAILASMIRAALAYQECGGLGRPERIAVAVDQYASSEDTLGQWIAECLEIQPNATTPAAAAYKSFSDWAEKEGAFVPSAKRFSQQLSERGFERRRVNTGRQFIGFTVKLGANL